MYFLIKSHWFLGNPELPVAEFKALSGWFTRSHSQPPIFGEFRPPNRGFGGGLQRLVNEPLRALCRQFSTLRLHACNMGLHFARIRVPGSFWLGFVLFRFVLFLAWHLFWNRPPLVVIEVAVLHTEVGKCESTQWAEHVQEAPPAALIGVV